MTRLDKVLADKKLDWDEVKHIQVIYYNLNAETYCYTPEGFMKSEYPEYYFAISFQKGDGLLKLLYCMPGLGEDDIVLFN